MIVSCMLSCTCIPRVYTQCAVSKCLVLVCWLGRESLQNECIRLVRELWTQGISADLLYESLELDSIEDIQEFCRKYFIPHIVILNDKTLFYERKQVKVRTLDSGKVTEKMMTTAELIEFLQQRHSVERTDYQEAGPSSSKTSSHTSGDTQSNALPSINFTVVPTGKLFPHIRRRLHEQVNCAVRSIPPMSSVAKPVMCCVLLYSLGAHFSLT